MQRSSREVKKKRKILGLVAFAVIFLVIAFNYSFVKGTYNKFVDVQETVDARWADVENNLQRRYDLIPNLVNTVKGYAKQEREVFLGVTEARAKVGQARDGTRGERIKAEQGLSGALSRLLLVVENYPQIKSDANFRALQDELAGTENRLAVARKRYNDAVRNYNVAIRVFPQSLIANMFDFAKREFFEAPEEAQQAPQVEF
ncbi:MAG: Protein LemA [Calditrichaeota bacterium]|nr:Protein LemA [Calditrichota bacterium]